MSDKEKQWDDIEVSPLAPNALVSVEELINTLKVSPVLPQDFDYDNKVILNQMIITINELSAQIESYIQRSLGFNEYAETITVSRNPEIKLRNRPIVEVKEVIGLPGVKPEYLTRYTDSMDLQDGILQLGMVLPMNRTQSGLRRFPQFPVREAGVVYTAGYVLPADATPDNPSNVPADLKGVVLRTASRVVVDALDANKAAGMIMRQEGNVNRQWQTTTMTDLLKFGLITQQDRKVLDSYKTIAVMESV